MVNVSEQHDNRTMEEGARGQASISGRERGERPGPRGPRVRTCVGCGERVEVTARGSLVRLIIGPEGEVAVDAGNGGFGRGAHVHPRPDCLAKAVQRGLAKAAKGRVHAISSENGELAPLRADTLAAAIKAAMDRRIEGLLVSAGRSRQVALGSDSVTGACERGEAALVVVACDAAAAADLAEVRHAISEGRAVSWGTKLSLGALFGGGEAARPSGVGVVAITSSRIGEALREAVHIADASAGGPADRSEPRQKKAAKRADSSEGGAPGAKEKSAENAGPRAGGGHRNASLSSPASPRRDSRRDLRSDSRQDSRKDSRQEPWGDQKGSPGRAGKVSLGIAAGAAANRRVGRVVR
jgi:predicted RNA-binding protein YlxR (DUF448 family)/ribosomal protein L7Ae-like RNA K-turn-binding protein